MELAYELVLWEKINRAWLINDHQAITEIRTILQSKYGEDYANKQPHIKHPTGKEYKRNYNELIHNSSDGANRMYKQFIGA